MPLDGHAYLVSQGWEGKGSGLRKGALAKPLAAIQKKTLSGVGKDRDEAFPFWDHVFSAAASAIKIKTTISDDESDSDGANPTLSLQRTQTGIISNRRPVTGTPVISGSSTSSGSSTPAPRISVLAAAKQEAARRTLYSMFFRGPVMRSDDFTLTPMDKVQAAEVAEVVEGVTERLDEMKKEKMKNRKSKKKETVAETGDDPAEKEGRERKRKKNSLKEERRARKSDKLEEARESTSKSTSVAPPASPSLGRGLASSLSFDRSADRAERKRRREEKRARKEEKRKGKEAHTLSTVLHTQQVSEYDAVLSLDTDSGESVRKIEKTSNDPPDAKTRKRKREKDASS